MPTTAKRILRHGLLAALLGAVLGFLFAQVAGVWFDAKAGERPAPAGGAEVTEALEWRVPFTMAGWAFGLTTLFELFGSLWRTPSNRAVVETTPQPDAETLLLELLDQAEAAERQRSAQP
jgi:hypothetical protein